MYVCILYIVVHTLYMIYVHIEMDFIEFCYYIVLYTICTILTYIPLYYYIYYTGWASLMAQGEDGFNKHTQNILETTQIIAKGVREIQGLRLLGGTPEAMIVCFAGKKYSFWVIWFNYD